MKAYIALVQGPTWLFSRRRNRIWGFRTGA